MTDFKFEIGEEVKIINVNGSLHHYSREHISKNIISISRVIGRTNHGARYGFDNHYCLLVLAPDYHGTGAGGDLLNDWWFHEDNLGKITNGLDVKSIINKVFTGRSYD